MAYFASVHPPPNNAFFNYAITEGAESCLSAAQNMIGELKNSLDLGPWIFIHPEKKKKKKPRNSP